MNQFDSHLGLAMRSRPSRWIFLPLLCLLCFKLFAGTAESSARALHLLGYLSADYPATVAAGEVVDAGEYREQLEFLGVLQELLLTLPAHSQRAELETGLAQLRQAIEQRAEGALVSVQARHLASRWREIYQLSLLPAVTPDPQRGQALYVEHCSVCHGVNGAGDGPAGIGLQPPPANLQAVARLDNLSLYDLFNTLSLGIDGTEMASFSDQLDERQRWDLASYIAGFSAAPAAISGHFSLAELVEQTPAQVQVAQGMPAAASFRAMRAKPPLSQRGPQQLIEHTQITLDKSLAAYANGEHEQAYDLSVGAYLEGFELVEGALNNLNPELRKATEKALMTYRQALQEGLPLAQLEQRLALANEQLNACAALLKGGSLSASLSFISSLMILLREGLEAILVLAAILAFLRNTGQKSALRSVHLGWGLALLAGVATWAVAAYVLSVSGAQRELLEGGTALFASVVLLWVGVWMHDRRHAAAWQSNIRGHLQGGGGRFGFAALAFFAVYRELFEVILFYETLWLQAGPAGHAMVLAGAGTALLLLVLLAWVILRGSAKLPLATFFSVNAVLLCVLSVVYAGHGVKALQEAGIFGAQPVVFFEFDWLGIHPDAWSLGAQSLALLAVAALYGRSWLRQKSA
jgi:high-affinity iron transporter